MESYTNITDLLLKHLRQELTPTEEAHLTAWVEESDRNRQFFANINNTPGLLSDVQAYAEGRQVDVEAAWAKIKAMGWEEEETKKVVFMQWWRYMAAAVVLVAIGVTLFYLYSHPNKTATVPVVAHTLPEDAMPNSSHAYLTLDNGSTIMLDSLTSGYVATQGSMKVERKKNGALSYLADGKMATDKVLYNKVTVPRGSDVVYLQLSDETKVWLNAESSIRYPVVFSTDERKVEITGEAYFEVTKQQGKRFIVSKGAMSVTVLGTKFNVNTYENEDDIKVTLLEGSVKVQRENQQQIIKPGQQAVINAGKINVVSDVDLQQVMAWKEGKFVFNNTNIQLIMRQMERWYDLAPTQFENDAVKKWEFNGEISRYNNASKVLQLLEKTGSVKFTVEGKKIMVSPQ